VVVEDPTKENEMALSEVHATGRIAKI